MALLHLQYVRNFITNLYAIVIEPEPEEDFPPEGTSADEEPKEIAGSDVLGETSSLAVPVKVSSAISIASTRSSSSRAESKRGLKSRKGV